MQFPRCCSAQVASYSCAIASSASYLQLRRRTLESKLNSHPMLPLALKRGRNRISKAHALNRMVVGSNPVLFSVGGSPMSSAPLSGNGWSKMTTTPPPPSGNKRVNSKQRQRLNDFHRGEACDTKMNDYD